jgi:hypothetical protein
MTYPATIVAKTNVVHLLLRMIISLVGNACIAHEKVPARAIPVSSQRHTQTRKHKNRFPLSRRLLCRIFQLYVKVFKNTNIFFRIYLYKCRRSQTDLDKS